MAPPPNASPVVRQTRPGNYQPPSGPTYNNGVTPTNPNKPPSFFTNQKPPAPKQRAPFKPGVKPPKVQDVFGMQKFLQSHGFDLAADGVIGPITRQAQKIFALRISNPAKFKSQLAAFNERYGTHQTPAKPTQAAPAAKAPPAHSDNGTPGQTPLPSKTPVPSVQPPNIPNIFAGLNIPMPSINPAAYARAAANLQFGPLIAQIIQQRGALARAEPLAQQNIRSFYAPAVQQAQQNITADQAASNQAIANSNAATQGFAQALGLGGADTKAVGGAILPQAQNVNTTLTALGQAQNQQDQSAIGATQRAEALQHVMHQNATSQNLQDLAGQLLSAVANRGNAYTTNYAQAQQLKSQLDNQAIQGKTAEQNALIARALAGPQIMNQRLQNQDIRNTIINRNKTTQQDILNAEAGRQHTATSDKLAQQQLTLQKQNQKVNADAQAVVNSLNKAKLTQLKAQLNPTNATSVNFTTIAPKDRASIATAIRTAIGNPNGSLHLHLGPNVAYQVALRVLQSVAGANPSAPDVRAFARNQVLDAMVQSNYAGKWKYDPKTDRFTQIKK